MSISYFGNKIISFYKDAQILHNGGIVIPRFVSQWLTTVCDLKCKYCYFSEENTQNTELVDTNSMYKFIDELVIQGVESLEFSGGGEPTLHKDCFNIAEYAYNSGLKVGLLTNGHSFDLDKLDCFTYVRVGLDSIDSKGYTDLKGGPEGRFDKTIGLIEDLISKRKQTNIGVKFMINGLNYDKLNRMVDLAKGLKVDYCHFKGTHNDKFGLTNNYSTKFIDELDTTLNILKERNPGFVFGSFQKLQATTKCFMSPIHTVITAKGDLLVCCYAYQDEYVIGNVFKDGFEQVWFSNRHKEIMDKLNIDFCNKVDCRWHKYNQEMLSVIHENKYNLSFI